MCASLLSRLTDNYTFNKNDDFYRSPEINEMLLTEMKLLFLSRVRIPGIEDIELVNASVLNYGIDESLSRVNEINNRRTTMEHRIKNAVIRFEPRLTQISISSNIEDPDFILFTINAYYMHSPLILELKWNHCTGRFYFNE